MKIILVLICCFNLISCATKKLWEDSKYTDTIAGYVLSGSGDEIIIYGEKYVYTVSADESIKRILTTNSNRYPNPLFNSFYINNRNRLSGKYHTKDYSTQDESAGQTDCLPNENATASEKHEYKSILEYTQNPPSTYEADQIINLKRDNGALNRSQQNNHASVDPDLCHKQKAIDLTSSQPYQSYQEGTITGSRATANKKITPNNRLEAPYYIIVKEEPSTLLLTGKIIVTPLAIVADAAIASLFILWALGQAECGHLDKLRNTC